MKLTVKLCLIISFLLPANLKAQDSIKLICPLNEATVVPPPKNVMQLDEPDLCIVLVSIPDTIVKAVTMGRVTNVVQSEEEEGKWEVVFFCRFKNKEYYFWYTGLSKPIVRKNDVLKAGQALGYIKTGEKIELLMYDFETPVDPLKYLDCKGVLKASEPVEQKQNAQIR
jgi:hypothetical protein